MYLTHPPATPADHRRAAVLHGGGDAVLSGTAALTMLGFRVPQPVSELVLVPTTRHIGSWRRIKVRKTHRPPQARSVAGVALAPPARANWRRGRGAGAGCSERQILEIDSTEYHFSQADHDATLLRDQRLQAVGYAVMHVKPGQVRDDPEGFVRIVTGWPAALDAGSAG